MLLEVDGFVLSETPYGETSRIINVLTKDYGVIGIMCKGAKSLKSKNRVSTMKQSYSKFNIYYKKDKLSTLVSSDIINPLKHTKNDIILVSFLGYLTELTNQVIKQSNNTSNIYDLFIAIILKIEEGLDPLVLTNILEIKYLEYLGVLFNLDECVICGSKKNIVTIDGDKGGYICLNCLTNEIIVDIKVIKMLRMYYYINVSSIKTIKVADSIKNTIKMFLDTYYERYTGLYLSSKDFLKKLLWGSMANLTLYYGTMAVGKTTKLLQDHYNYTKYLLRIVVMKPKVDTKGGNTVVTRIGNNITVDTLIPKSANLLSNKYKKKYLDADFILVDEAQFLSKSQINDLWYIAHKYNISVICYALKSNFKGDLFEGSMQLFARSDEKHELTVNCICGKPAMFNARRVNGIYSSSGKEVVIDGENNNVEYIPLCSNHYLEYVIEKK